MYIVRPDASGENSAKGGYIRGAKGNWCRQRQGNWKHVPENKPGKGSNETREKGGKRETEGKKATWRKERGYCIIGRGKKEERKKRKKGKMEPHPCQTRRRFVLPSPSDIFFFLSFPVSYLTCIKLDVRLVLFLPVSIDIGRWLSLFIII